MHTLLLVCVWVRLSVAVFETEPRAKRFASLSCHLSMIPKSLFVLRRKCEKSTFYDRFFPTSYFLTYC
jgi:hypothetical protein